MSAGALTCATLANVQLEADKIWADAAKNKSYIAKVETLRAVTEQSTVRFEVLKDATKDRAVQVYWMDACDSTTAACTDECTISGAQPEETCKTYALDSCRHHDFTIPEKAFRAIASTYEEALAVKFLKADKVLSEYITNSMVSFLYAHKGVNALGTASKGVVTGFTTTILPSYWNPTLFSYFQRVAEVNKMYAPYLISGSNLYEAYWQAKMNAGNADGKGALSMFDSMKSYFDLFNMDTTLTPDQGTFMVDANAVAFVSKAYYEPAATADLMQWGGPGGSVGSKFKIASKNIPGLEFDVVHKIRCSSNEVFHDYSVTANWGNFINPIGCDLNNTGIEYFKCA